MTDDLVKRLDEHEIRQSLSASPASIALCKEAAARIKQLTEALRSFICAYGLNEEACTGALDRACAEARAALAGSPPAPSAPLSGAQSENENGLPAERSKYQSGGGNRSFAALPGDSGPGPGCASEKGAPSARDAAPGMGLFVDMTESEVRLALAEARDREAAASALMADYLARVHEHAKWGPENVVHRLRFMALGLCGEVGELANLIKKDWRGDEGDRSEKIIGELTDVCGYTFMIADILGIDLIAAGLAKVKEVEQRPGWKKHAALSLARGAGIKPEEPK